MPFVSAQESSLSLQAPQAEESRVRLISSLRSARRRTDSLFTLLTPEGLFERPIAERHRLLFYLGHLEAFDWNLLCRDVLGRPSLSSTFEKLFAFGIDPIDGELPTDTVSDWPEVAAILEWRHKARQEVDGLISSGKLESAPQGRWALHMAIEHRLMHAETLCYLLCRLDTRFKRNGPTPEVRASVASSGERFVPAGSALLGLSRNQFPHRGWDNEYERHTVHVPAFRMSNSPVSNAEWLNFIESRGYQARTLWEDTAWAWLAAEKISAPAFWVHRDGRWWWRTMFGEIPLPGHWPVYVSHAEATAYARWKHARLPTEAEWHRASFGDGTVDDRSLTWRPGIEGNFGFHRFEPTGTGEYQGNVSPYGISDLSGNGWEWTSTVFAPFKGFEPLPFYPGYSANFFDGKHFVLKGASPVTDVKFLRPSFRNWFQPHYQYVFAKFRLVLGGARG